MAVIAVYSSGNGLAEGYLTLAIGHKVVAQHLGAADFFPLKRAWILAWMCNMIEELLKKLHIKELYIHMDEV